VDLTAGVVLHVEDQIRGADAEIATEVANQALAFFYILRLGFQSGSLKEGFRSSRARPSRPGDGIWLCPVWSGQGSVTREDLCGESEFRDR
jgi:hypothetical protein